MPLYDSTLVHPCLPIPLQPASPVPDGKRSAAGPGGGGGRGSALPLGRSQAELRLALSQAHISPPAFLTFSVGGRLAELSNPDCLHTPRPVAMVPVPGAVKRYPIDEDDKVVWAKKKRGTIKGFSRQSRIRMMKKLARVNHRDMKHFPVMCTLTYPGEFPTDNNIYKVHLDTFHKRFERRWGKVGIVWKLEFQARGAAHFHLLIYFNGSVDIFGDGYHKDGCGCFRCWVAEAWYGIVGSGDERHLWFLRTKRTVEALRSVRGVQSYVSKYVAKVVDGSQEVGRWWGVWDWHLMPVTMVRVMLGPAEFYRLRRVFAGVRRSHDVDVSIAARRNGLWLFLDEEQTRKALDWLLE